MAEDRTPDTKGKHLDKDDGQLKLNITQWNGRSIHTQTKINFLRSMPTDIVAIQEIWKKSYNIKNIGQEIDIKERETKRGGGTASFFTHNNKIQILEKIPINKDSSAVKIRICSQYIWLINIYNHKGTSSKIQRMFGKLRNIIPINEWKILCIIGDFNVNIAEQSHESDLIKSLSKQMGLKVHIPSKPTRKHTTIDFMITGINISIEDHQVIPSPSDHNAINWNLKIQTLQASKSLTIPNRQYADELMLRLLNSNSVTNAKSFLQYLHLERTENKKMVMKTFKPRKGRNMNLFNKLLQAQESADISEIIDKHWARVWKNTEDERFSKTSKLAYNRLRDILKYHLYQKRDGGIINSIIKEDGAITNDQEEIEKLLLKTMEEIQVDHKWGWIERKPFPKLERMNEIEVEELIETISTNKAIAYDATSDILFKKSNGSEGEIPNIKKTAMKLRNLWRIDFDSIEGMEDSWDSRLVPLNKVFPHTPSRTQLRPITIQSPVIKLLEAKFAKKLHNYLNTKLDRAQVGFVKGLGIQVNLVRALKRITLRTAKKQNVYGVFIDFSQAYNSVPHTLLFKKLRDKNVLNENEICFLEQLYSRYTIRIGNSRLRSNKGVAQGSIISPALFDIFIEDLSTELREKGGMDIEDLLFYADDILMLCTSIQQAEKCIQIIEQWSAQNGMNLNKEKSGIIIFANRRATKIPKMKTQRIQKRNTKANKIIWVPEHETIGGIQICDKYKYLGTYLTPKLSSTPQIEYIKKKTAHLYSKLYPYLINASADARRDMWQTMVAPLFNAVLALLYFEPSKVHRQSIERLRRCSFKDFLMISKRTNTVLVDDLIRKDIHQIASATVEISIEQWEHRRNFEPIQTILPNLRRINGMRGVPNEWCKLINTQVRPCPRCKEAGVVTDRWHLKYVHKKELQHVNAIWRNEICPITQSMRQIQINEDTKIMRPMKRWKIRRLVEPIIQRHLKDYNEAISDIQQESILKNK